MGLRSEPESHLIPLAIEAALGGRSSLNIFGTDYATPHGTCVRDYVHVSDICSAHLAGLEKLLVGFEGDTYNLGNNQGFSVREVVEAVERVSKMRVPIIECARREGDQGCLVANASEARSELNWKPNFSSLDDIVSSAWRFQSNGVDLS